MDTASKEAAVLDSSYVLTYLLPDEANQDVDTFFENVSVKSLYAPPLIECEVANALVTACRRSRVTHSEMAELWELFKKLSIIYIDVSMEKTIDVSIRKGLSAYDASYIVLAKELGCRLFSLDKRLTTI